MANVRDAFFNYLYELSSDENVVYIVTADLGAPSLDDFRIKYPDRYISVGIAEQNLLTVASGICLTDKSVVAYGLNPFPVTRAYDQMRDLMAELKIPITVAGLNAGLCSAESGYTHMPIDDMCMVRNLMNIRLINPTDETISQMSAERTLKRIEPIFIRFDKALYGKMYERTDIDFKKGFTTYGNGNITIISMGYFIPILRKLVDKLGNNNIKLVDMFSLPINEDMIAKEIENSKIIYTIEENVRSGGIGSYILEILSDKKICKNVERYGLNLVEGYPEKFVSRDVMNKNYNIDLELFESKLKEYITHG